MQPKFLSPGKQQICNYKGRQGQAIPVHKDSRACPLSQQALAEDQVCCSCYEEALSVPACQSSVQYGGLSLEDSSKILRRLGFSDPIMSGCYYLELYRLSVYWLWACRLKSQYAQALAQIDEHLAYWPKFLVHKNKQRLTKITQYLIRMRRLATQSHPKLVPLATRYHTRVVLWGHSAG